MDESQKQKEIQELKTNITNLENELEAAKRALFELTEGDTGPDFSHITESNEGKIVEGTFNGENMIGPEGKIFPVPANYASKSKLVEGDKLKLTISPDGSFVFKQIGPIGRKHAIGKLVFENSAYYVESDSDKYNVLYASVTYHKAKPNDKVSVIVPAEGEAHWAALESVLHELSEEDRAAAQKILEEKVAEELKTSPVVTPVDGLLPVEAHTAPNYSDTDSEEDQGTLTQSLDIDSIEIRGPKNTKTPDAVNPAEISQEVQANTTSQSGKVANSPIAELEI